MAGRQRSGPDLPSTPRVTLPSLNKDPTQSLQPWPVLVTVAGGEVSIPALSAASWLSVLMVEDLQLDDIFPGLLEGEDSDWLEEQIVLGQVDLAELQELILAIVENVSARKWWVALRLVEVARRSWDHLGAEMLLRGIDASRISLAGWLDVLSLLAVRNIEPEQLQSFLLRLEAPPEGEEPEEMEMNASTFLALGAD